MTTESYAQGVICRGRRTQRSAFTMLELIVVVAILLVALGLALPTVQKVREGANSIRCSNNLRQLGLASQNAHDVYGALPPGLGWYPRPTARAGYGTPLFHLLPFVEKENLYKRSYFRNFHFAANHKVYSESVSLYICPSDPSVGNGGTAKDALGFVWGASSYACNAQVFCHVTEAGEITDPRKYTKLPFSIPDGMSSTILFGEKYARCSNSSYPAGGNLWAYWFTGPGLKPFHPGVEVSWTGYSIGPASKFQVVPAPFNGNCDPTMASTPHRSGMHVVMADGSVRFLSSGISPHTWWYLCTPTGGETIAADAF